MHLILKNMNQSEKIYNFVNFRDRLLCSLFQLLSWSNIFFSNYYGTYRDLKLKVMSSHFSSILTSQNHSSYFCLHSPKGTKVYIEKISPVCSSHPRGTVITNLVIYWIYSDIPAEIDNIFQIAFDKCLIE